MTTIPDFKAQGLLTKCHELGAAMSGRPRPKRELAALEASDRAGADQLAATSEHVDLRSLRESIDTVT
jgi:hypothetical protein